MYFFFFYSNVINILVCRGLADTKHTGKLNREQFSLAMYLIQQKATRGIDPPSTLTPDMIPPSERAAAAVGLPVSPCSYCFANKEALLAAFFTSQSQSLGPFVRCVLHPIGHTHWQ